MNVDEAFTYIKNKRPNFVHISGKTSTGKSTFANKLKQESGYEVVELDKVVDEAVIVPLQLPNRGLVFYEVYKKRHELEWINLFTSKAQEILLAYKNSGSRVVIDGAIANTVTLQELLAPFLDTKIIYLHPSNIETYQKYLTSRFLQTSNEYHAGLPVAFWELIKKPDFEQFCQSRILTPALAKAIADYAIASQLTSKERLEDLRSNFNSILVVEI